MDFSESDVLTKAQRFTLLNILSQPLIYHEHSLSMRQTIRSFINDAIKMIENEDHPLPRITWNIVKDEELMTESTASIDHGQY